MSTVTVKDLPEKLHRQLKARALRHRRSLNREIIACLEATAAPQRLDVDALLVRTAELRGRVSGSLSDADLLAFRSSGRR